MMDDQKLLEIIDRYEREVPDTIYEKMLDSASGRGFEIDALNHLMEMFPQMREFVQEGRREKLMRWLGWVQGVLFMCGVYTLEEMKHHNMPEEDK